MVAFRASIAAMYNAYNIQMFEVMETAVGLQQYQSPTSNTFPAICTCRYCTSTMMLHCPDYIFWDLVDLVNSIFMEPFNHLYLYSYLIYFLITVAGKNIEFSFATVGRLSIRNRKVKMRFYKEFINSFDGSDDVLNTMQNVSHVSRY